MVDRVDEFLAGVTTKPVSRGNLVFALDATGSRERTWDTACKLQAEMFRTVATVGSLSTQLVYYRGVELAGGECKASRWLDNPIELATLMSKISCNSGPTQIARVLGHVAQEALRRKIHALVFVGDACEEDLDQLAGRAAQLAQLQVPAFMFHEGQDRTAKQAFMEIARITHGAYHQFNEGSAAQLAELLRIVALFAVGGIAALEQHNSATAKRLLAQVRSG